MHHRSDYLIRPWIRVMVGFLVLAASHSAAGQDLPLEVAVDQAVSGNPGLAAMQARARALAAIPDQVGSLPDPTLSVNLANLPLDSFSFVQEGMTQLQVGISQMLPSSGKLALRSQAATYEANAAEADVAEMRQQLIRDVRSVWWNLFFLDRSLDVIARNQVLLGDVVHVAETRYRVGRGQQQEILLSQLELSKLAERAIRVTNVRENEAARLNVIMGRPASHSVTLPSTVNEELKTLLPLGELATHGDSTRPRIAAQQERLSAAQSRIDLAERDRTPDFKVGAMYGVRNGDNPDGSSRADLGSIMFSVNLPVYARRKQARAEDQRTAEWLQQKYKLQDQRNHVAAEIIQAATDYERSGEQVRLFTDEIIPQARQTVDSMLAGYQVGKAEFLNVIRSQTILFDHEIQYWRALSAANQALARLVAAVGEEDKIHE